MNHTINYVDSVSNSFSKRLIADRIFLRKSFDSEDFKDHFDYIYYFHVRNNNYHSVLESLDQIYRQWHNYRRYGDDEYLKSLRYDKQLLDNINAKTESKISSSYNDIKHYNTSEYNTWYKTSFY